MFLWFFVLPELVPADLGHWLKRDLPYPEFYSAMVCLGLYTASRVAEQVRSGINSVPPLLGAAARASGMSLAQTYRYILLPLGYRIIVPPLTSEFLGIFKNTSLALTIGVMEITASSRQIESYTFQGYEAFTAATAFYLSIAMLLLFLMRRLKRARASRAGSPAASCDWRDGRARFQRHRPQPALPVARTAAELSAGGLAIGGGIFFGAILAVLRMSSIKPVAWLALVTSISSARCR